MKKIILLLLLSEISLQAFSQKNYLGKKYELSVEAGTVTIFDDSLIQNNNVEYGKFEENISFDLFKTTNNNWFILSYENEKFDFLTLCKSAKDNKNRLWEIPYQIVKGENYSVMPELVGVNVKNVTSFVVEKNKYGKEIRYAPEGKFNLFNIPWAVKTGEKNKKIIFDFGKYPGCQINYEDVTELLFVNGFVDPDRPYLFKDNARVKTIRINCKDFTFEADLKDTGNLQSVKLPSIIKVQNNTKIQIEILDYYIGDKYSDIVLSGIFYINAELDKISKEFD